MTGSIALEAGYLLYTRAGFEGDAGAELVSKLAAHGRCGTLEAPTGAGYVRWIENPPLQDPQHAGAPTFRSLVFARQFMALKARLQGLSRDDRLTPLLETLRALGGVYSGVWLETADTNESKQLSPLLRAFERPLRRALEAEGLLGGPALPRLHVFFESGTTLFLATSLTTAAAPWPMGIPRLRFPRGAPSRSTLKLDEAFHVFLREPDRQIAPGMTAVDLGAAPGGWTFQLVNRHLRVIAVDNGPLAPSILESGLVEHRREDGFRFRPSRPVDWLVCDMIEKPDRIARLVSAWVAKGWCGQAIFNLKLPMKQRWQAVSNCRALIESTLSATPHHLLMKQLYHDRAEITGYLSRLS